MFRLRLSALFIVINVSVLLAVIAALTFAAMTLLQRVADEQAVARVTHAATSGTQIIERTSDEAALASRLLAERPTLQRLLRGDEHESLTRYLDTFRRGTRFDAIVAMQGSRILAQTGRPVAWGAIGRQRRVGANRFLQPLADPQGLVLGSVAPVPSVPDAAVGVALLLDDAFARRLGGELGLAVQVTGAAGTVPGGDPSRDALRAQSWEDNRLVGGRLRGGDAYLAVAPLHAPSGEVVGLLETRLPATAVNQAVGRLARTLLLLSLAVLLVAAAVSFVAGTWVGRPLRRLSKAASGIGRGDFDTPVPVGPGAEVGRLSVTLEEMRRRLLSLTTELRRQQRESRAILGAITEGVFAVDRERRIRYLNPQMATMLGIDSEAALGRFCGDVLNPQGPDGIRPCEQHCPIVHARAQDGARATEHLLLRNGQRRTVVLTSAPEAGGQQVQVMRDETETETARRLRDTVLANLSHEFRTPLSAQLASLELLMDRLPDLSTAEIGELAQALQRSTLRLTRLIDNLLESVRIEAGEDTIRRSPVALDQVIEDAVELMRPLLVQRDQEVELELPDPGRPVVGDAPRLTQVFVNLLANAQKFAPERSTIRIGGTATDSTVVLWVEDQGPGFPSLDARSLFDRFVRSTTGEPDQSGMGLGLWIVKSIVERHGGRVDLRSDGSGTRITVILPLESDT